jgi:phage tail P2-like protein
MSSDIRTGSLLGILPDSLADEEDIVALCLAIDPELRDIAGAVIEVVIWPRIASLPEPVLDAIAWGMRFNEFQVWDDATVAGKRALLDGILDIRRRMGTRYAVRRIFDLLQLTGRVIEWWEEGAAAHTYRLRIIVTGDPGVTLKILQQIPELLDRAARASQQLTELAVEADAAGSLHLYPALTVGRHVTIPFGGP